MGGFFCAVPSPHTPFLERAALSMVFKDKNSGLVMTGKEVMGKLEGVIIIMEI